MTPPVEASPQTGLRHHQPNSDCANRIIRRQTVNERRLHAVTQTSGAWHNCTTTRLIVPPCHPKVTGLARARRFRQPENKNRCLSALAAPARTAHS